MPRAVRLSLTRRIERRVRFACLLSVVTTLLPATLPAAEPATAPVVDPAAGVTAKRLGEHVRVLSSKEYGGRSGPAARLTAEYLAARFAEDGLRPAFDKGKSFFQPIPAAVLRPPVEKKEPDSKNAPPAATESPAQNTLRDDEPIGWNVAAVLPGSDPVLSREFVVFGAHYDHLGVRRGEVFSGADDNASGVAALIEAAHALAQRPERPKRSVLFVGFDLEEVGLFGSTHFVAAPPVPLESVKLFLNADMIGRDAGGLIEPFVFVVGSERSPELRKTVEAARLESSLQVGWIGADLIGPRSDHAPFEAKRVPFLFFSTGEHPDYHSPRDVPERLNHDKHARIARLMTRTLLATADAESPPVWREEPLVDLEEVRTACRVLDALLETPGLLKEGTFQRAVAANTRATLQGYLDRGSITAVERAWLVSTCKLLLESL